MDDETLKMLILGAHPDDAEYHAGGLATLYRRHGHAVKFVSVTDGGAGHHVRRPEELRHVRRRELAASAATIGATSTVWDFPDGSLEPTLEVRRRIIREIRTFQPDLVLTHRTCDYHPDHRAVAQAVQDASYMVTVPLVAPETPALRKDPVVAYMCDLFTRPAPLRPDVVLDVTEDMDSIMAMLAQHRSQVFEWLPYNEGVFDEVPEDDAARNAWLRTWCERQFRPRSERFRDALIANYGEERGNSIQFAEIYEISEYAAPLDDEARRRLFSFG